MKLIRKAGSTSHIFQIFIQDSSSTVGAGLTGLVFNSASLTAYYHRHNDTTATAITLVTMTVGTFTSSGFKEIDATNMPGWYQFCPPDASCAAGANSVAFHLKGATNMAPLPFEVDLVAYDPTSATSLGLSNLTTPLTAAQIATGVWQDTTAGDFTVALSIGKSVMNGVALGTGLTINAYTGDTPQTGDAYARIGAAGVGLTAVGLTGTQTFNNTGTWTGNITGNLSGSVGSVTGAVGSVTGAVGSVTGAVGSVTGLTASNLDATVSSRLASASYVAPTTALTESYAALHAAPTTAQLLFEIRALLAEASVASTTLTAKKIDGTTTGTTYTLDSSTAPTSITRSS